MGAREIRAGKAYIELGVKDKLASGLKAAGRRLGGFALGVGKVSLAVAGVAAAAAIAATKIFTGMGSGLTDMSKRTGLSVEALSELKYAAEQTGSSAEGLEVGIRKMQKTISDAADGGKEATEALADLALSYQQLRDLKPEDQFRVITSRLRTVTDPTERAAAALKVFGKSGTALLPMAEDLDTLTARARELGLVMSAEDAAAADTLGDKLDDLWKVTKQGAFVVGSVLAPVVELLTDTLIRASVATSSWSRNGRGMVAAAAANIGGWIDWLVGKWDEYSKAAKEAAGGAIDALLEGDFRAAGEISVAQLKMAFLELKGWFDGLFADIGDAMVAAQIRAIAASKSAWAKFMAWTRRTPATIGDAVVLGKLKLEETALRQFIRNKNIKPEARARMRKELAENLRQQADVRRQTEATEQQVSPEVQAQIDAIEREKQQNLDALGQISSESGRAERERLGEEILKLEERRKQLADQVKADRALREFYAGVEEQERPPSRPPPFDPDDLAESIAEAERGFSASSRGTFNAAAVQGLQGTTELKQVAKATKETAKNTADIAREAKRGSVFS